MDASDRVRELWVLQGASGHPALNGWPEQWDFPQVGCRVQRHDTVELQLSRSEKAKLSSAGVAALLDASAAAAGDLVAGGSQSSRIPAVQAGSARGQPLAGEQVDRSGRSAAAGSRKGVLARCYGIVGCQALGWSVVSQAPAERPQWIPHRDCEQRRRIIHEIHDRNGAVRPRPPFRLTASSTQRNGPGSSRASAASDRRATGPAAGDRRAGQRRPGWPMRVGRVRAAVAQGVTYIASGAVWARQPGLLVTDTGARDLLGLVPPGLGCWIPPMSTGFRC